MPKLIVSEEKPKICLKFNPFLTLDLLSALVLITFFNKVDIVNTLNAITIKVRPKKYLTYNFHLNTIQFLYVILVFL